MIDILIFIAPFYKFLHTLISPQEILQAIFLIFFVVCFARQKWSFAIYTYSKDLRFHNLALIMFIFLNIKYIINSTPTLVLIANHGFWLVFSVYLYHHYSSTRRANDCKRFLIILYAASNIVAFALVFDNFNKLVLRQPAFFDAIQYTMKANIDSALDPNHLSYRAVGLLGSRAYTTCFIGLGGLAGLALFWRSRAGAIVFIVHSVLMLFCFGLTAFIGFQLAFFALLVLTWRGDRLFTSIIHLGIAISFVLTIVLLDFVVFPLIFPTFVWEDSSNLPRPIIVTFMALIDDQRSALLSPYEIGILGLYSRQLEVFLNYLISTDVGFMQLLIGFDVFGSESLHILGYDWGLLDWVTKIGIAGAGLIVYLIVLSISVSGGLLCAEQLSPLSDNDDSIILKRFVFLASIFFLLTSFHYNILLTREFLPFFFCCLAFFRRLKVRAVIQKKLAAQLAV